LKTGGAYVPMDPSFPAERIDYILSDSGSRICIDDALITDFVQHQAAYAGSWELPATSEDSLAYVLYTSGSTGRPKGCMLGHKGVVNRLEWMWRTYGFTNDDAVLQKTTFTFDVSVWEIFLPLCWGCRLVLCEDEDVVSPARIGALIATHQVTHIHFVPGMLDMFMAAADTDLSSLKQVIASGEALSVRTVNTWYSKTAVPLNNLYGPTEASIDVTSFVTRVGLDVIPIGKPVSNTRLYVLDANRQLLPVGVAGELYIGGVQLAQGYLNRPLLTESSFVDHPFIAGERLYRTGDLVRWQPDGNLVYMGRTDDQVKVRGYRIELGEVEHALLSLPDITGASVRAVKDKNGEYNLIGYVISEVAQSSSVLYERLLERIPAYMVPGRFMQLSRF
ncbi:amino acid adenylation domain-containing protein, partial [Chitinophaga varians]|uniref:amino acid adenylation domain-containing protein n=1 Tax=Chitinophaga varians TaxID=2202339 RepID=UPI00165F899A